MMKLFCLGDLGFSTEGQNGLEWEPPAGLVPGGLTRILLNWELPLGEKANPKPRHGPRLFAKPEAARVIGRWAPGFVALANNHVMDAGVVGLAVTIKTFREMGFSSVGAGLGVDEITCPLVWETVYGRLGILNWVFADTHPEWLSVPGPNCWPGPEAAAQIISILKQSVDWMLVLAHWSDELCPYPQPVDRTIARGLVKAGADLVIAHHPHVVRGMEKVDGCPIFYSLGNYYFSDFDGQVKGWNLKPAPRNRESLGVEIDFRRGQKPEYKVHSFWQVDQQVNIDPKRRAERRLKWASRPLKKDNPAYKAWYAVQRPLFSFWGYRVHFRLPQLGWRGLMRYASHTLRVVILGRS
jgi:hypothetical protein